MPPWSSATPGTMEIADTTKEVRMAMPQQTEIIKRLRTEVADQKSHIANLLAEIRSLSVEKETLVNEAEAREAVNALLRHENENLKEDLASKHKGYQADLDGAQRKIQSLLEELTKFREEAYQSRDSVTDAVAEVESKNFDERQDLLKGLEKIVIALGRSA